MVQVVYRKPTVSTSLLFAPLSFDISAMPSLTQINAVDPQPFQTRRTGLLSILSRAVDLKRLAPFHEAEFGGQENLVALAGSLEPPSEEFFGVSVETV